MICVSVVLFLLKDLIITIWKKKREPKLVSVKLLITANLNNRHDFPTPESPINNILNKKSLFFQFRF